MFNSRLLLGQSSRKPARQRQGKISAPNGFDAIHPKAVTRLLGAPFFTAGGFPCYLAFRAHTLHHPDLAKSAVRHPKKMRIGQLARSADVHVETIRYYQRIGLIKLPKKPFCGVRSYNDDDFRRLRFIRRAQRLGFSLEDIRALLELSSSDCQQVQELAEQKLKLVNAKLKELRNIQSALTKTIQQCTNREKPEPCPIIETLAGKSERH